MFSLEHISSSGRRALWLPPLPTSWLRGLNTEQLSGREGREGGTWRSVAGIHAPLPLAPSLALFLSILRPSDDRNMDTILGTVHRLWFKQRTALVPRGALNNYTLREAIQAI